MILTTFDKYLPDPAAECETIRFLHRTLGIPFWEIADKLGITRERVRQLESREILNPNFYSADNKVVERISGVQKIEVLHNGMFAVPPYIRVSKDAALFFSPSGETADLSDLFCFEYCPEGCMPGDFHEPVGMDLLGGLEYHSCTSCDGGYQFKPPKVGTDVEILFDGTVVETANSLLVEVDPDALKRVKYVPADV